MKDLSREGLSHPGEAPRDGGTSHGTNDITREGLIDLYIRLLDAGDLDGMGPVYDAIQEDPELRRMIADVTEAYAEDAGLFSALDAKLHTYYPLDRLVQEGRAPKRRVTRPPLRLVWKVTALAAALLLGIVGGRYLLSPASAPFPATHALADLTPHAGELTRLSAFYRGHVRSADPTVQDSSRMPGVLHRLIMAQSIDQLLSVNEQAVWGPAQEAAVRETMGELRDVYAALTDALDDNAPVTAEAEPMRAYAAFLLAKAALMLGDTYEAQHWLRESLKMDDWRVEAQRLLDRLKTITG